MKPAEPAPLRPESQFRAGQPANGQPNTGQSPGEPPRSVFVYGTLMPGESNAAVAQAAGPPSSQERATLSGYALHDLSPEGYPALTQSEGTQGTGTQGTGHGTVQGWLLHYSADQWPAALLHLDDLEGLHLAPPLYTRSLARATTASGLQTVWVYLYARLERLEQPGCAAVPSGDWTSVTGRP
jgi:gamma-glutamylcyclotransferase (GGCT)/AIG2-like uncharacterized protein YtfP